ncbi:hypothetical protein [Paraburkholderia saeva]|uniref:hypothetical protein n=1 Tax=Paraburkholderia saeva TaxID=2777537 RepID=UPI001E29570F|nr:hypothetical protein [Paraburkholderia saeva]
MTNEEKLEVYRAQVANVRMLEKAWNQQVRAINEYLVKGQEASLRLATRQLALLYSAHAEVVFSKAIHTPYGLSDTDISDIKGQGTVPLQWHKALDLGLTRVSAASIVVDTSAIRAKMSALIKQYIETPSIVRNKIAHGQWAIALNGKNTKVNNNLTAQVESLNVVELGTLHEACSRLANILELLIESPSNAFPRDFDAEINAHAQELAEMNSRTIETRIEQLKKKKANFKVKAVCSCAQKVNGDSAATDIA